MGQGAGRIGAGSPGQDFEIAKRLLKKPVGRPPGLFEDRRTCPIHLRRFRQDGAGNGWSREAGEVFVGVESLASPHRGYYYCFFFSTTWNTVVDPLTSLVTTTSGPKPGGLA